VAGTDKYHLVQAVQGLAIAGGVAFACTITIGQKMSWKNIIIPTAEAYIGYKMGGWLADQVYPKP